MTERTWPSISIIIPTLNAAAVLDQCLGSVASQDYPKEKLEIIIADGGSKDQTLEIAKKYHVKIFSNPLKTGESGKALGFKKSSGSLLALVDSDNVLPSPDWIKRMVAPLIANKDLVGAEPWGYTWRKKDGFITRWAALTGVNDPLCLFLGNYDRRNYITNKWTGLKIDAIDKGSFLEVLLTNRQMPTIGANGTILRREFLNKMGVGSYLFDIDLIAKATQEFGPQQFAKVKIGIVHLYCGRSIRSFIRKQKRRVVDFIFHEKKGERAYPWRERYSKKIVLFVLANVLVVPILWQTVKGWWQKHDIAWLFHPLACWITLIIYGVGFILSLGPLKRIFFSRELNRDDYGQKI